MLNLNSCTINKFNRQAEYWNTLLQTRIIMNKKGLFYVLVGALFLGSCTATKPLTSAVQPREVSDIQKFETYSYITLVEKGNRGKLNDTISKKAKLVFDETLSEFKNIPLTGSIMPTDTMMQKRIEREIEYLCVSADRQRSISSLQLTPVLDSLLDGGGKRFGLITVTTGFTRDKGNYGGQIAKGIGMGILTMGMYYQTPVKANSTIYCMIIDAKDNNVAFFRKSSLQDKEPLDKSVLSKQIRELFEGYFWPKG